MVHLYCKFQLPKILENKFCVNLQEIISVYKHNLNKIVLYFLPVYFQSLQVMSCLLQNIQTLSDLPIPVVTWTKKQSFAHSISLKTQSPHQVWRSLSANLFRVDCSVWAPRFRLSSRNDNNDKHMNEESLQRLETPLLHFTFTAYLPDVIHDCISSRRLNYFDSN